MVNKFDVKKNLLLAICQTSLKESDGRKIGKLVDWKEVVRFYKSNFGRGGELELSRVREELRADGYIISRWGYGTRWVALTKDGERVLKFGSKE